MGILTIQGSTRGKIWTSQTYEDESRKEGSRAHPVRIENGRYGSRKSQEFNRKGACAI